jgi:hypothetical protein
MRTKSSTLDFSKKNALSQLVDHSSPLSRHSARWQGMYLEFQQIPPLETPESICQQNLILIPLVNGIEVERKGEDKTLNLTLQICDPMSCGASETTFESRKFNYRGSGGCLWIFPSKSFTSSFQAVDRDNTEKNF